MSIKLHNQGEYLIKLTVPGTQATSANAVALSEPIPFDGQIKAVWAKLGTAGTTSTQQTDLLKNGATMLSSGVMFSFPTTVAAATYGDANLSANPTQVSKGDILSLLTSAINTTPGKDLSVGVVIQRRKGTGCVNAMLTDTYGNDVV